VCRLVLKSLQVYTIYTIRVHRLFQSGLVLVDTPGVGENEFLEAELTTFISGHDILGFIYIIKTDNAGGVQEDRVRLLFALI